MKAKTGLAVFAVAVCAGVYAQSPVRSVTLAPDQVGVIKCAQGITTRIVFSEPVKEMICGDLYDGATGRGTFVLQRGDSDVFLKPVASKGSSNLFVKTGQQGEHVFNFDLTVVPMAEAHRVVTVNGAAGNAPGRSAHGNGQAEDSGNSATRAKQQADELIRGARQQADRIVKQAEQRAGEIDRQALDRAAEAERQSAQRAEKEIERRFLRAVMMGLREIKIGKTRVTYKQVTIALDQTLLTFDEKSYLRYTIQNNGRAEFRYNNIELEIETSEATRPITATVIQSKAEKTVLPGETVSGVIVFDLRQIEESGKLSVALKADGGEIARIGFKL